MTAAWHADTDPWRYSALAPICPLRRLLNQPGMTGNVSFRWCSLVRA